MIILSMENRDAGQAVVLPHSLKMVARAELTLSKPSRLTMIDRSTAGAADGGKQGEGMGPFPLPFFIGAMATEEGGGKVRDWLRSGSWSSKGGRTEGARATERGVVVYNCKST